MAENEKPPCACVTWARADERDVIALQEGNPHHPECGSYVPTVRELSMRVGQLDNLTHRLDRLDREREEADRRAREKALLFAGILIGLGVVIAIAKVAHLAELHEELST